MSVLDKIISYYPGIKATTEGVDVNLLTLLHSNKHKERIFQLRQSDGIIQKQLKSELPCYTVSGIFNRRCEEGLIKHSGLAAVDLDAAEEYDKPYLLNQLKELECIAYAGLSCRGQRLFCIVPFKYPEKYQKQYERLIQSFEDMGMPMGDACHKQISQPRFVSWNDESTQFFNHDAKLYDLLPSEKKVYVFNRRPTSNLQEPDNKFEWCVEQINKSHSFKAGLRHDYIIHLTRYCNLKGISQEEALTGCLRFIEVDFHETEIKGVVKGIYKKQADSHAKFPFRNKESEGVIKEGGIEKPQPTTNEESLALLIQSNPFLLEFIKELDLVVVKK